MGTYCGLLLGTASIKPNSTAPKNVTSAMFLLFIGGCDRGGFLVFRCYLVFALSVLNIHFSSYVIGPCY